MALEALLGLHDQGIERTLRRPLERKGYKITSAPTAPDMLTEIEKHGPYDLYLMDVNLEHRGLSYKQAELVYNRVKDDVTSGRSQFYAITGNPDLLREAKAAGIPCLLKPITVDDVLKNP